MVKSSAPMMILAAFLLLGSLFITVTCNRHELSVTDETAGCTTFLEAVRDNDNIRINTNLKSDKPCVIESLELVSFFHNGKLDHTVYFNKVTNTTDNTAAFVHTESALFNGTQPGWAPCLDIPGTSTGLCTVKVNFASKKSLNFILTNYNQAHPGQKYLHLTQISLNAATLAPGTAGSTNIQNHLSMSVAYHCDKLSTEQITVTKGVKLILTKEVKSEADKYIPNAKVRYAIIAKDGELGNPLKYTVKPLTQTQNVINQNANGAFCINTNVAFTDITNNVTMCESGLCHALFILANDQETFFTPITAQNKFKIGDNLSLSSPTNWKMIIIIAIVACIVLFILCKIANCLIEYSVNKNVQQNAVWQEIPTSAPGY